MISFDVDPMLYAPTIITIVCSVIMLILYGLGNNKNYTESSFLWAIIFAVIAVGSFYGFVMSSSVYTDTITICAHTEGNYMKVVDTNQNLYYVNDDTTQLKIKDNIRVKVKIENRIGTKYIYSIDAPITCGNSSCEVSST
jgi:hypothetical protein